MVLLVIGIKEGVEIAKYLLTEGYPLEVVATNRMCREQMNLLGMQKYLLDNQDAQSLENYISRRQIDILVDASSETSSPINAQLQELKRQPVYIRYLREELEISPDPLIKTVYSIPEAIDMIIDMKADNVFLTTGSYGLEHFISDFRLRNIRIVARVLPEWKIIKKCQDAGLKTPDIVAMQGPFSKRLNKALFKTYNADVIISRDSGKIGGADTKISAALELKIPIIVIKRKLDNEFLTACGMPQFINIFENLELPPVC